MVAPLGTGLHAPATGQTTAGAPAAPDAHRTGRRPATSRPELERVAFELFDVHGFTATGVDEIATAAGIGRRTFFRYYASKSDLVWGDFDGLLARLTAWFAAAPADLDLLDAVRQAVVDFNSVPPGEQDWHRRRLGLILGVPALRASSAVRFAQWREVVSGFAARRLGVAAGDLLPNVIGHCALGATTAAYEVWLARPGAELVPLIDRALGELADGFRRHQPPPRAGTA